MTRELTEILFASHSISRNMGGIFEVERNLALELTKANYKVTVVSLKDKYSEIDSLKWNPIKPKYTPVVGPQSLGFSPQLKGVLNNVSANVGHVHTLWDYTSFALLKWAKKNKAPFIYTPNGMLNHKALHVSSWKKKIALKLYAKEVLENVSCIQVNTPHEYEHVRSFGLKNPICMIGNGVHLPDEKENFESPWKNKKSEGKKILLYIGRIHPTKGIHHLIESWNNALKLNSAFGKSWHLVVVGFGFYEKSKYENEIQEKAHHLNIQDNITFLPPHFGDEMKACYTNCDAFILPSITEGIPMALLTAWTYKKAVLMTPECNLSMAFDAGAAIRVEYNEEKILEGLIRLFSMSENDLSVLGNNGYALVRENFTWNKVASQLIEVYNWVLNKDVLPSTIVKDDYYDNLSNIS